MTVANNAMQEAQRVLNLTGTIEAKMAEAYQVLSATGVKIENEPFLRLERALSDVNGEAFRVIGAYLDAQHGTVTAR